MIRVDDNNGAWTVHQRLAGDWISGFRFQRQGELHGDREVRISVLDCSLFVRSV